MKCIIIIYYIIVSFTYLEFELAAPAHLELLGCLDPELF